MNPKYPMYIVSKGRWKDNLRLTSKALESMKLSYFIVVEKHEYDFYSSNISKQNILVLPQKYLDEYDTCDDLGENKSKGAGAARNYCWQHSIQQGFERHWVFDDNINGFIRLYKNERIPVTSAGIFCAAEDFIDRYKNVAIAGFDYRFFAGGHRRKKSPYRVNSRVYSCLLIRNDIPYRWRGRYNEDTDLSLRVLKEGWCTIVFQIFMCNKVATQTMEGGNTDDFYKHEGTLNKSQMLKILHPELTEVVWRYNRWHHHVDYRPFKKNKLIKKEGIEIPKGINNYGMVLKEIT